MEVCGFLGIDYQPGMSDLDRTSHHNLYGNALRLDNQKRRTITYDMRWLHSSGWVTPYALLPGIERYNRDRVWCRNGFAGDQ